MGDNQGRGNQRISYLIQHYWGRSWGPRSRASPDTTAADGQKRDERPLVTKRFYRSPDAAGTPGHGLGLSLVAAVAELHGFAPMIDEANPGTVVRLSRGRGRARLASP